MRRRIFTFGAVIAAMLICFGACRHYSSQDQTSSDPDGAKIRHMLDEEIARKSSRADVESYLDSRGVSHSFNKTYQGERNVMLALFRGHSTGIVRRDVQVKFRFDESDRLVDYTVRELFTGP